jgi:hypothetical protein
VSAVARSRSTAGLHRVRSATSDQVERSTTPAAEAARETRDVLRAAGVCQRCRRADVVGRGRACCPLCAGDVREHHRGLYATRRAAGLCMSCRSPATGVYCDSCAARRQRRRALAAARKRA